MEARTLSQFEIDSLMSALNAGPSSPRSIRGVGNSSVVKEYDFRRPDKLSKDHLRTLHMMHDTFARLLSSSLSTYLRIPVQVRLLAVEQASNDEYMDRIEGQSVLSLLNMRPLSGRAVLELSLEVAFAILDRLLGGEGRSIDGSREVTDIELSLLESVAGYFHSSLKDAWMNVVALDPYVEDISLNPQFLQRALPNDMLVIFAFELKIREADGVMHLSFPQTALEPILSKLSAQFWFARSGSAGAEMSDQLRDQLEEVHVSVRAELGRTSVTVRELSDLQPGDVIHLGTFIDQELDVYVGKERKFRGRAGVRGNRVSVQITQMEGAKSSLEAVGVANG